MTTDTMRLLTISLISFAWVGASFFVQGHLGINLSDEGYLWYGAVRTLAGEIPIRDFQAYDPGRYIWAASWMGIFGDGLMSLRQSVALFEALAILCGLLALQRVSRSYALLVPAGGLFVLWMFPMYKIFDIGMSMIAVYVAVLLLEKPTLRRYFAVGIFVGLTAFVGRNHGLYNVVAFFFLTLFVWLRMSRSSLVMRFILFGIGVVVGYMPMLIMVVFIPGFLSALWDSVVFIIQYGSTNLAVPIPWPWMFNYGQMALIDAVQRAIIGALFVSFPVFVVGSLLYLVTRTESTLRRNPLLVAATFVGLPYTHYAFSRADIYHLSHSIFPLLMGILAIVGALPASIKYVRSVAVTFLLLISMYSIGLLNPFYLIVVNPNHREFVNVNIGGEQIVVERPTADLINAVKTITAGLVKPGEHLAIAPHYAGIYPIIGQRSPLWEIYLHLPRTVEGQQQEIQRLTESNTNWVILSDVTVDSREDLRFKNTHAYLYEFINKNFVQVRFEGLPEEYSLYKRAL